jgi:hypothetical protein
MCITQKHKRKKNTRHLDIKATQGNRKIFRLIFEVLAQ